MKRNLLFTLFCLTGMIVYGQQYQVIKSDDLLLSTQTDVRGQVWLPDSSNGFLFYTASDSACMVRTFYKYDDFGNPVCDSSLMFYAPNNEWIFYEKTNYEYGGDMTLDVKTLYMSAPGYGWVPDEKFMYYYHPGDTMIKHKTSYLYDDATSSWKLHDSTAYSRNGLMQIDTMYNLHWKEDLMQYEPTSYMIFVYNNDGLRTSDTTYQFLEQSGVYELNWLRTYAYDAYGNEIEYIASDWDEGSLEWDAYEKYIIEYNDIHKRSLSRRHQWNNGQEDWHEYERYYYTYDENENMELVMSWELDEGNWTRTFTYKFFWSLHNVVDIPETTTISLFTIYPNPATDRFNIYSTQIGEVCILNLQGKIVKQIPINKGQQVIDCSNLKAGLYLIKFSNNGFAKKLLVR